MSVPDIFDASTVAIVLPSMLLWSLILVSAHKSDFGKQSTWLMGRQFVYAQILLMGVFLIGSFALLSFFPHCLHWNFLLTPGMNWNMRGLLSRWLDLLVSVGIVIPLLGLFEFRLLRFFKADKQNHKLFLCQWLFFCCVGVIILLICLPLMQLQFMEVRSWVNIHIQRDAFRCAFASASLPSSIAGLCVALGGRFKSQAVDPALALASTGDFSLIATKSCDELHVLIDSAVELQKLDLADKLSRELLSRFENS